MLPWILGGIALGALAYLLSKLYKKLEEEERREQEQDDAYWQEQQRRNEAQRRQQEIQEQNDRADKVRQILQGDPRVGNELLRQAGQAHLPLEEAKNDEELIKSLARQLPKELIDALLVASLQKDFRFDLNTVTERAKALYPTADIEPEPIDDISRMGEILPIEMVMPEDEFYRRLASGESQILQSYERYERRKRMYMLRDVSGSMGEAMRDGMPKHTWARGIAVSLLMQASDGEAEYFYRDFDGAPHPLKKALTADEADALIGELLRLGNSGGGTNIFAAFSQAVSDIRSNPEAEQSEIVIISDGEDRSMDNTEQIKQMLGKDIRLHIALIGASSSGMQAAATSYRSFE